MKSKSIFTLCDELRAAVQDLADKGLLPQHEETITVDGIPVGAVRYPLGTMFIRPSMIERMTKPSWEIKFDA